MADPDTKVHRHIDNLVAEEHKLFESAPTSNTGKWKRIAEVQVQLDQYWDLLRQRRARREFGDDPTKALVRPPDVIKKYEG